LAFLGQSALLALVWVFVPAATLAVTCRVAARRDGGGRVGGGDAAHVPVRGCECLRAVSLPPRRPDGGVVRAVLLGSAGRPPPAPARVREPAGPCRRPLGGAPAGSRVGRTRADRGPRRLLAPGPGDSHLGGCPGLRPGHAVHALPAALLPAAEQTARRGVGTDRPAHRVGATEADRPRFRSRAAAVSAVAAVLPRRRGAQRDADPDRRAATRSGAPGADAGPGRAVTPEPGLPQPLERRQLVAHGDLLPGVRPAEHVLDGVRRCAVAPAPAGRAASAPLHVRARKRSGIR